MHPAKFLWLSLHMLHAAPPQRGTASRVLSGPAIQGSPGVAWAAGQQGWAAYIGIPQSCNSVHQCHMLGTVCAQASIEEGAVVLAYALHSDKTHVGMKKTRAVHPFNVFPLQGGIQLTRKPSSVCRLAFAPVVLPRDLGIPDSLEKRTSKQREL